MSLGPTAERASLGGARGGLFEAGSREVGGRRVADSAAVGDGDRRRDARSLRGLDDILANRDPIVLALHRPATRSTGGANAAKRERAASSIGGSTPGGYGLMESIAAVKPCKETGTVMLRRRPSWNVNLASPPRLRAASCSSSRLTPTMQPFGMQLA